MRSMLKPMSLTLSGAYNTGDRIHVRSDVVTPVPLPGHVGTIHEVIPCYNDDTVGYNIHIDGDTRAQRVWFFLHDQLQPVPAQRDTNKDPE